MQIPERPAEFCTTPAVFAVNNHYQIMVPVKSDLLFWVTVNNVDYYDHSNGIIRSSTRMHRVNIPMKELDLAGSYTVHYRKIIERKPYFPTSHDPVSATYPFYPIVPGKPIRIYHMSDTHGNFHVTSSTGSYFSDQIDLLILNGDIPDHSGDIQHFTLIYQLIEALTSGTRPTVFSRGNHDMRGFYAENLAEYTPTENGHSYYTFRLGPIWGMVMDCGEDKPDDYPSYGHTICCHQFRLEETAYLEDVIKHAGEEYLAEGISYRFIIVHNPFSYMDQPPFDIEGPLFKKWLNLLGEHIKPQLMIAGHLHQCNFSPIGSPMDSLGQACPVIVGSNPILENNEMVEYIATALTIDGNQVDIAFTNSAREILKHQKIKLIP